jgi:hypothetical protein
MFFLFFVLTLNIFITWTKRDECSATPHVSHSSLGPACSLLSHAHLLRTQCPSHRPRLGQSAQRMCCLWRDEGEAWLIYLCVCVLYVWSRRYKSVGFLCNHSWQKTNSINIHDKEQFPPLQSTREKTIEELRGQVRELRAELDKHKEDFSYPAEKTCLACTRSAWLTSCLTSNIVQGEREWAEGEEH